MKLIAGALITAVMLSGCSKSEEYADYDPLSPNFPAPYCAGPENNNLDAKRLKRSPEQFTNMCGYAVIQVTDASRWAEGVIKAQYTTTPEDIWSYNDEHTFIFRNKADAKEMYEGDKHSIKLFVFKWPEQENNNRQFYIWCLFTFKNECD